MARNVTQTCSIPVQEASSFSISAKMIKTILTAVSSNLTRGEGTFEVFNFGDSRALSFLFSSNAKIHNVAIKNRIFQCKVMTIALSNRYPQIRFKFGWVKGDENLADLNSKYVQDPISIINSRRWRHGLPSFLDEDMLNQHIFYTVHQGTELYIPLPVEIISSKAEQEKISICNQAVIRKNKKPLGGATCLDANEHFQTTQQEVVLVTHEFEGNSNEKALQTAQVLKSALEKRDMAILSLIHI